MSAEDQFRDRALDLASSQLATLFVEFQGLNHHDLRFDTLATHKLRQQVAEAFSTFIAQAPVESVSPELTSLMRPGQHSMDVRKVNIDCERTRLEQAGLLRGRLNSTGE